MAKRFQTYFGIPIPPFKEEKLGAGSTTIRFILTGNTPSKKNNEQAVTVRRHARKWAYEQAKLRQPTWEDVHQAISMCKSKMRPNAAYLEYLEKVRPILHEQSSFWANRLRHKGLIFPLKKSTLTLRMYFKGQYITDTVNKQQTIQDLLKECSIISDDDYRSLNPINSASACYFEELIYDIAFISLSFKL